MENNLEYFCILGGGGIRGCSYTGVLKAIEELKLKITGWAGSSIGAVVATYMLQDILLMKLILSLKISIWIFLKTLT